MSRTVRIFSSARLMTVGITQTTFQHRHLLRAEPRLNRRIIGALAKAQKRYGGHIHALTVMSTHLHLLASFRDTKQMADFMRYFTRKVSVEAKKVHGWTGRIFPDPYTHIELSQEESVELQRLRYVLANGCKEGLVLSPKDWPGASSTEALIQGEPLRGVWLDRTALWKAWGRKSGRNATEEDFEEPIEVELSPLPSQAHLSPEAYRNLVAEMVRDIEAATVAMHRQASSVPLGAAAIRRQDPHRRQKEVPKRPRPWCHASNPETRRAIKKAIRDIVAAYRRAAELLKSGVKDVRFPAGTFPPGLPYVPHPVVLGAVPNHPLDDG